MTSPLTHLPTTTVLRNVRPMGLAPEDLLIEGGRIAARMAAGAAPPGLPVLADGQGQLLLPALVESHIHLDKTLWATPWRPNSAGPTRDHRIRDEQAAFRDPAAPLAERAGPLIEQCIARGSLHLRSHVDVQSAFGLARIEEMLALRERYRGLIDLQLVAFPQAGLLHDPGAPDLMVAALERGLELVGAIDPAVIDRDPIRHLEQVFGLATRFRRGIDIHLHEPGELGRWEIERLCDMTLAHGLQGQVMISHGYCLGSLPEAELGPLADRLAELQISIMTCAQPSFTVPPVAALRRHGVNLCSGSDNIRDTWSPMGNGDMLERAMLIALRFGWKKDVELELAFDLVSHGGARALGLPHYGLEVGCHADLMLLPAANIAQAVVERSPHRTVIRRGRIVARDGIFCGQPG